MADLETAADAALSAVNELKGIVDRASTDLNSVEDKLGELSARLDSDWTRLAERVDALVQAAETERGRLETEGGEATRSLSDLAAAVEQARTEESEARHGARDEVTALAGEAADRQPELSANGDAVEADARSLADRAQAIDGELTAALGQVRDFVGVELVAELQEMERDLDERADQLHQSLADDQALIDKKYAEWESHLVAVDELLEKAFGDARQHVEDVVLFSMTECVNAHHAAVADLKTVLDTMEAAGDVLKATVEAHGVAANTARQEMERGMTEAAELLTNMITSLTEVKDLMTSYTFVVM